MRKIILFIFISGISSLCQAQMAVFDAGNQATSILQHAEEIGKWTEQINRATEQVNKLNDVVSNLGNIEGVIGKGMGAIGIDPSITGAIGLAKAVNNFGSSIKTLQHTSEAAPGRVADRLDRLRQEATDPESWQSYVVLSKSYEATQTAQKNYDDQMAKMNQERAKAESQLSSAQSLGAAAKAQAALSSVDAAANDLAEERKRAFEQQQANFIENQNQKDAWEQASRDWTAKELKTFGTSLDNYLKPEGASK